MDVIGRSHFLAGSCSHYSHCGCKSSNLPENPPNNPRDICRIPISSEYFMVILIHFGHVGMDQYLLIPLVGWTSINPSYFDVNYRGTIGFDPSPCSHETNETHELFTVPVPVTRSGATRRPACVSAPLWAPGWDLFPSLSEGHPGPPWKIH